jgi:drug/metabolite transporter superfamily protein YnfA
MLFNTHRKRREIEGKPGSGRRPGIFKGGRDDKNGNGTDDRGAQDSDTCEGQVAEVLLPWAIAAPRGPLRQAEAGDGYVGTCSPGEADVKTSSFKRKVARRAKVWAIATVVVLLVLLAMGYAFLSLVDSVIEQKTYLMLIGGMFIVLSFVLGQAVERIVVRSFDTWVGQLGPTQISVLIPELEKQKEKLLREEER